MSLSSYGHRAGTLNDTCSPVVVASEIRSHFGPSGDRPAHAQCPNRAPITINRQTFHQRWTSHNRRQSRWTQPMHHEVGPTTDPPVGAVCSFFSGQVRSHSSRASTGVARQLRTRVIQTTRRVQRAKRAGLANGGDLCSAVATLMLVACLRELPWCDASVQLYVVVRHPSRPQSNNIIGWGLLSILRLILIARRRQFSNMNMILKRTLI